MHSLTSHICSVRIHDSATYWHLDEYANRDTTFSGMSFLQFWTETKPFRSCRVAREANDEILPNFTGCCFPENTQEELHSALMLLLLTPWSNFHRLTPFRTTFTAHLAELKGTNCSIKAFKTSTICVPRSRYMFAQCRFVLCPLYIQ